MSRRKRGGLSPSLFPFLAVLVCTLGTLILLLALVAQDATDNAQKQADAAREKLARDEAENSPVSPSDKQPSGPRLAAEAVAKMIDEEEFRVRQLVAFRDKQTADLEKRRDQMGYLENQIVRLQAELKQLSTEVDRAVGDEKIEAVDEAVLVSYRKKVDEEAEKIKKLKGDSNYKTPRVVIVPHKGPNGTARRPIYLECEANGLVIWPEGTRISLKQLEDSSDSANPLDAALRLVRNHAMKNYGDTTPPYPLLVVRPDGIETYGAARNAMEDWDDQFGYELVPTDLKLAHATPDANLKRELETTIARAVANQSSVMVVGIGGGRGSGGSDVGSSSAGKPRVLSAASLDRASRTNGYNTERGSENFGSSSRSSSSSYGNASSGRSGSDGKSSTNGYTGGATYTPSNPNAIDPQTQKQWADDMQAAAQEMKSGEFGPASLDSAFGQPMAGMSSLEGADGQSVDAQSGNQNSADSKFGSASSTSTSNSRISSGSTGTGGTQSSGSQAAAQAAGAQSSNADGSQQASPSAQINATPSRELVKRKGRDWALPKEIAGVGGNAIVRTIRVQCFEDRFVLLPPSSGGATEVFGFLGSDVERATLEMATSIRDRVDRWGVALPGGRWQPRLDVEVMPGGDTRFFQMRSLMDGSGVEVEGRGSK